jgi:predicted GNAT family acetyltransferase
MRSRRLIKRSGRVASSIASGTGLSSRAAAMSRCDCEECRMSDEASTDSVKTEVVRNELEDRYEVWRGDRLAGFTDYREHGTRTVFIHTEIGEEFGGKGLGGVLAKHALEDVIERGHTIVPVCPFMAGYLRKHPEYEPHVAWPTAESVSEQVAEPVSEPFAKPAAD